MGQVRTPFGWGIMWNLVCVAHPMQQQLPPIQIFNISDASSMSHALTDTSNVQMLTAEQTNFNRACEWLDKTQSWFGRYNKLLVGSGCIAIWGVLYNRIVTINNYLQSACWSAWKEHLSLERLANAPQDELAQELLMDIQHQYLNPANPVDSLSPLITFLQEVEREKKTIQEYLFFHKWAARFYITRLFPFIASEIKQADVRLQRLVYVKQLFSTWAVDKNFAALTTQAKRMIASFMEEDYE